MNTLQVNLSHEVGNALHLYGVGDTKMTISKGALRGRFRIENFEHPNEDADAMGFARICFEFVDEQRRGWRHENIVSALELWPSVSNRVAIVDRTRPPGWMVGFLVALQEGRQLSIRTREGEQIDVPSGRNTFGVVLYPREGGALGRARVGSLHPRSVQGWLGFEYQPDLSALLWHRATLVTPDELCTHVGTHVDLSSAPELVGAMPVSSVRVSIGDSENTL